MYPIPAGCGTDTAGRGAFEPPPEDGARTKLFDHDANFGSYPDAADVKIQPTSQDYLLKIQHFCNFSLLSLSIHPRSRRGAQRIRRGEGRWSHPPKTLTRWSRPPKTFTRWSRPPKTCTCFIRSSPADVKQNKQTLKPCRRQAKQRSKVCHRKIQTINNYRLEMMPIL